MAETLYDILGVNKAASKDEIKKAYRNLSKQHHPDVGGDEEMFKKISNAYNILSDDEKKKNYDTFGDEKGRQHNPFSGGGPFGNPFGGNPFGGFRMRARPISVELPLTIEEVFHGAIKNVRYNVEKFCNTCNGIGASETKRCDGCGGKGARVEYIQNMQHVSMCGVCGGSGIVPVKHCNVCRGRGRVISQEAHELKIPKGIVEGNTLVMEGMGNHVQNAERGDVHLIIKVQPHPVYSLEGIDLHKKEEMSFIDMVLGCNHELDTLSGKFKITIPEGCETNRVFRLKGQGIRDENTGHVGDLYVKILPKIPKNLSQQEKETLLKLKTTSNNFS